MDAILSSRSDSPESFEMSDGFRLSCMRWVSSGPSRGSILCIHGTGENSEFFNHVGEDLSSAGFDVYAMDLRGFGLSVEPGLQRGDTSSFKRQLTDIVEVLGIIQNTNQGEPVILLGHSHGCAYTIWCAAHHKESIKAVILAAPPIASTQTAKRSEFLKFAVLLMLAPKTKYRFGRSSSDPRIPPDSPVPDGVSIRWLYGTKRYLHDPLMRNAVQIKVPVLILQGGKDTSTLPEEAKYLLNRLTTQDKTLQIFDEADHFLFDEFIPIASAEKSSDRATLLTALIGWLEHVIRSNKRKAFVVS